MGIIVAVGAENFQSSADMVAQLLFLGGVQSTPVTSTTVRSGALGVCSFGGSTSGDFFYITVAAEPTVVVECWAKPSGADDHEAFHIMDGAGNKHLQIHRIGSGGNTYLRIYNANSVQVGSDYLMVGAWKHIGVKVTIGNSGSLTVHVDDVVVPSLDNITGDFQNGATATVGRVQFQVNNNWWQFDDIVIQDQNGAFLGSGVHCVASFPTAAGDSTQMTPSTGSNFQCVDEADPNEDTDYVSSATATHLDLYNITNLPAFNGNVLGVDVWMRARKDNGGTEQLKIATKTESVVYYGPTEDLNNSYALYRKQYLLNPNTGVAWTQTEANAAQIGAEVV